MATKQDAPVTEEHKAFAKRLRDAIYGYSIKVTIVDIFAQMVANFARDVADKARREERERCAKVCDAEADDDRRLFDVRTGASVCARNIRALPEEETK